MLHQQEFSEMFQAYFQFPKNASVEKSIFDQYQRMQNDNTLQTGGGGLNESRKRSIYRFIIDLGCCTNLISFSPELSDHVIYSPMAARMSARIAIQSILSKNLNVIGIPLEEIHVVLRLNSLPLIENMLIERMSDFTNSIDNCSYVVAIGYVTSMTLPGTYVWSAQYFCTNNECCQAGRNSAILYHNVGGRLLANSDSSSVVDAKCFCQECGAVMVEDKPCRLSGTYQTIRFLNRKSFETPELTKTAEPLTIVLRDELCGTVELGKSYCIVGLPTYECGNKTLVKKSIEACYVDGSDGANERALLYGDKDYSKIRRLFEDSVGYSPYRFPLRLAYHFADTVCSPGTFFKVKLMALMSLVMCNDVARRLHLIATGVESECVSRLLDYARLFTEFSSVYVGGNLHTTCLFPNVATLDVIDKSDCEIQCGLLQAANDGVCLLPNLNMVSNSLRERLLKTVELDRISLEIPHKIAGLTCGSSQDAPFRSTIWACVDSPSKIVADFQTRFGFVLNTDFQTADAGDWYIQQMIRFISNDVMVGAKKPTPTFSDQEWRCFINTVRNREITVSKSAGNLLEAYYLTTRRSRDKECPAKCNEILRNFSIALCKLSFGDEVQDCHALLAVRLFEEFSVSSTTGGYHSNNNNIDFGGVSQLGVVPTPHFYADDPDEYFGAKNDASMTRFESTLRNFLGSALKVDRDNRRPLAVNIELTNSPMSQNLLKWNF